MKYFILRHFFGSFLRRRAMSRHYKRRPIMERLEAAGLDREHSPTLAQELVADSTGEIPALLVKLGGTENGLTDAEADAIRAKTGPNEIEHEKPLTWWKRLWFAYQNPFNLLLTLLAVVSHFTHDDKAAVVIATMVIISTFMRFWQEMKSTKAADALRGMVSNTATVLRRNPPGAEPSRRAEVPMKILVPGDVVVLAAGNMIPADCRILTAKDLFVSQSAMTGESMPVEKFVVPVGPETTNPLEMENLAFMATNVISGSATAVVLMTGHRTYFGALAVKLESVDRTPTQFQAGVNKVSWLLIRFMFVMAPLVLLINGFAKGNWTEAALFALSIAVGLTPEMLPMVVTSTLAKGAVLLSRKKVIVKRLDAVQNFGAMDILCTDKTGTLTQDQIVLERHIDVFGNDSAAVLEFAYLNSHYQTGLKNLLDEAVLKHSEVEGTLQTATRYKKVDEIPFDFSRRRMSVVVEEEGHHHELICKGAVEEMLTVCTRVRRGGADEPITDALLKELHEETARLNGEGLRVVGVGVKEVPPEKKVYGVKDETELTLVGYVAFLDPPKESAAPALKALAAHGVAIKVLTGDNELVTAKICGQVGLAVTGMMLGSEVESMSEPDLVKAVETHNVYAKLTPDHKERIVRAMKSAGHTVGYMGDGINDAPALRASDIGISVDSAVDIAKEAADIILLEKSLMVLDEGVLEGRRIFANMLKYLKMTASSNFGNVFSVLVASAFIPFLPMLPMHLLVQNLLYDIAQLAIPFDNVDDEMLVKPQAWNPGEIGRFMVFFGPVSSVFDLITYAVMWFVFAANVPEKQTLFQSGWFVVGVLTQTLIVHMIRTPKIPFIQSRAAWPLMVMSAAIMAVAIFLPMGPLAHYFKLQSLPPLYFPILVAILLGYMALTQAMKRFYIRRYGWQ